MDEPRTYSVNIRWDRRNEVGHDFDDPARAMRLVAEHMRMHAFGHINIEMGRQD